jgi:regulator of RNase E activity RraB
MDWPNDADGDVLRRLEESGFNFDKEVTIDFNIDFNHWPLTEEEKIEIRKLYPGCEFYDPDEEDIEEGNLIGYVQFQIIAKLTYELVMDTQEMATKQMKKYDGWCESWGVMQN